MYLFLTLSLNQIIRDMKTALKELKMIAKLNVVCLEVEIKIIAKNENDFNSILDQLDIEMKEIDRRWCRLENYANIGKEKKIIFTY